jgi:electron transport complex protein RnfC
VTAATYDLGKLHGGLRLEANKADSTRRGLEIMPVPAQVVLPLAQHIGNAAEPIVGIGERVLKGQLIARHPAGLGAPVHASTSGKVVAIEPWPVARRQGDPAPCIVIESDGEDRAIERPEARTDRSELAPEHLAAMILEGGIVGLGGAVFPTAQKIEQARSTQLDMLILNGVECEPWISCDDVLMQERAAAVIGGAELLVQALDVPQCYIVVESDKRAALVALGEQLGKLGDDRLVLKEVPTIYPSGAEDQLVQLVTNREVPTGGLPTDIGCIVQNVGTAAAVFDWVENYEPLISRIATVTGPGIAEPTNVKVRLGTTVAEVVEFAGGYTERATRLVIGGSMTGKAMSTDRIPVVKATNCILVLDEPERSGPTRPCIRCGECAEVCPIQLLPQQLYWYSRADDESKLRDYGLIDCIECGCCDLVCPSHISLTADFRVAKQRMRELDDEKARAERARLRFEARSERRAREALEEADKLMQQKSRAKTAGADAIAEIMRRKRGQDED